jgi:hypothetical protein
MIKLLYKKVLFVISLLISINLNAGEHKNITGETNLIKSKNSSLITTINSEYSIALYESKDKRWAFVCGGKLSFDLDHFSNEIKTSAFTTLGLEF